LSLDRFGFCLRGGFGMETGFLDFIVSLSAQRSICASSVEKKVRIRVLRRSTSVVKWCRRNTKILTTASPALAERT
jgi:hypothetical protein